MSLALTNFNLWQKKVERTEIFFNLFTFPIFKKHTHIHIYIQTNDGTVCNTSSISRCPRSCTFKNKWMTMCLASWCINERHLSSSCMLRNFINNRDGSSDFLSETAVYIRGTDVHLLNSFPDECEFLFFIFYFAMMLFSVSVKADTI